MWFRPVCRSRRSSRRACPPQPTTSHRLTDASGTHGFDGGSAGAGGFQGKSRSRGTGMSSPLRNKRSRRGVCPSRHGPASAACQPPADPVRCSVVGVANVICARHPLRVHYLKILIDSQCAFAHSTPNRSRITSDPFPISILANIEETAVRLAESASPPAQRVATDTTHPRGSASSRIGWRTCLARLHRPSQFRAFWF